MLEKLSKIYEIIIFTASQKEYADKIIDHVESKVKCVHHRLYRENCYRYSSSIYLKDLRVVDRDPKKSIIVDNSPYAFASQLDNGYPIIPFYDCKEDEEMLHLTEFLLKLQGLDDIRTEIIKKFKLKVLTDCSISKYIQYYQPGTSDIGPTDNYGDINDGSPPISNKIKKELENLQNDMNNIFGDKKKAT
jgi:CTD small phosphatase-like protein 2